MKNCPRLMSEEGESFDGYIESRSHYRHDFFALYGGLFFLGIFLGILFMMATVLIIYYKQISEGYEDKERFEIMQKVGLSRREVKKTIHSQVMSVFFLPLVTAIIHIAFAFPVISRLLMVLGLTNTQLFIFCTLGCAVIFSLDLYRDLLHYGPGLLWDCKPAGITGIEVPFSIPVKGPP